MPLYISKIYLIRSFFIWCIAEMRLPIQVYKVYMRKQRANRETPWTRLATLGMLYRVAARFSIARIIFVREKGNTRVRIYICQAYYPLLTLSFLLPHYACMHLIILLLLSSYVSWDREKRDQNFARRILGWDFFFVT